MLFLHELLFFNQKYLKLYKNLTVLSLHHRKHFQKITKFFAGGRRNFASICESSFSVMGWNLTHFTQDSLKEIFQNYRILQRLGSNVVKNLVFFCSTKSPKHISSMIDHIKLAITPKDSSKKVVQQRLIQMFWYVFMLLVSHNKYDIWVQNE